MIFPDRNNTYNTIEYTYKTLYNTFKNPLTVTGLTAPTQLGGFYFFLFKNFLHLTLIKFFSIILLKNTHIIDLRC